MPIATSVPTSTTGVGDASPSSGNIIKKVDPRNWEIFNKNKDQTLSVNSSAAPPDEAKEPSPSYHPTAEELAQSDDKGSDDDTALTGEENDEGVFIPEDGGSNEANPTQALSA